jgi:uncharacterized protein YndB with AHSA1/START domain
MENQTAVHGTFVIERSFAVTPDKVFDAFANSDKKRRWFFESERHKLESHALDFRVGGKERGQLVFGPGTPVSGMTCVSEIFYEDIVPGHRIVTADRMLIAGNCISAALVTIEILAVDGGTDLILTHQGAYFPGADGPEMRKGGWMHLMDKLGKELAT